MRSRCTANVSGHFTKGLSPYICIAAEYTELFPNEPPHMAVNI